MVFSRSSLPLSRPPFNVNLVRDLYRPRVYFIAALLCANSEIFIQTHSSSPPTKRSRLHSRICIRPSRQSFKIQTRPKTKQKPPDMHNIRSTDLQKALVLPKRINLLEYVNTTSSQRNETAHRHANPFRENPRKEALFLIDHLIIVYI